ncbi:hypothetical protein OAF83_02455 [Rubripirellula sp.]|nr:hypothetical protein [Rubripirellula sp.]MDB4664631.1 hypothetical protein [bacterium]MDB4749746.1 hypothetical protein [Rubripirellula sp.]
MRGRFRSFGDGFVSVLAGVLGIKRIVEQGKYNEVLTQHGWGGVISFAAPKNAAGK